MRFLIFVFSFLLFFHDDLSGQIVVSAEVDSTSMLIGDQLQLHLNANLAPSVVIQDIDLDPLTNHEKFEVLNESDWDTLQTGGEIILQKDLTFTIFDSGYHWIPEIAFTYVHNGNPGTVSTNQIPITVNTVQLADSVQLAPIKDILEEKANLEDWLPLILGILTIALVIGIFYWLRQRKSKTEMAAVPKIIIPPHELALKALHQLKEEKLWQQGKVKAYQSQLTYIIREYLEKRYSIPALESTTDEILRHLKKVDFDSNWKDKLRNILQVADLVKFAKAKPPADFHDRVWQEAEDFVIATKPKPVVVEETEES